MGEVIISPIVQTIMDRHNAAKVAKEKGVIVKGIYITDIEYKELCKAVDLVMGNSEASEIGIIGWNDERFIITTKSNTVESCEAF